MHTEYMLGAESTGEYSVRKYQFHPVTAHWRCPSGEIGWLCLKHIGPIDARAEEGRISFTAPISNEYKARGRSTDRDADGTTFTFDAYAPGLSVDAFSDGAWKLPGMTVSVETNLSSPAISAKGDTIAVTYTGSEGMASFELRFAKT